MGGHFLPSGHIQTAPAELKEDRFNFNKEGSGFVLLLEDGEFINEQKALCSSKGKASYWEIANKNGYLKKIKECSNETHANSL